MLATREDAMLAVNADGTTVLHIAASTKDKAVAAEVPQLTLTWPHNLKHNLILGGPDH